MTDRHPDPTPDERDHAEAAVRKFRAAQGSQDGTHVLTSSKFSGPVGDIEAEGAE